MVFFTIRAQIVFRLQRKFHTIGLGVDVEVEGEEMAPDTITKQVIRV